MEVKKLTQLPSQISHEVLRRFRAGFQQSLSTAEPSGFNINPAKIREANLGKLTGNDKHAIFGFRALGRATIAGLWGIRKNIE